MSAPVTDKDLPERFRSTQYAASVAARIVETFTRVATDAPGLLQFEPDDPDDDPAQITLNLTGLTPISHDDTIFTVVATGGKYPLTYNFRAQTDRNAEFHITPAQEHFVMPHAEQEGGFYGYSLDNMHDGWPESFARELAWNYLGDLRNMGYGEIPDQATVDSRLARLLPS